MLQKKSTASYMTEGYVIGRPAHLPEYFLYLRFNLIIEINLFKYIVSYYGTDRIFLKYAL